MQTRCIIKYCVHGNGIKSLAWRFKLQPTTLPLFSAGIYYNMWQYCKKRTLLLCVNPDNLSSINPAALEGTHQFKVKSILFPSFLRLFLIFFISPTLLLSISRSFSLTTMWAAVNVITKGWGWGESVYGEGWLLCMHNKTLNIKKLLSEKGTFWQIYGGGQLPPYVCWDGDNKSGSNYQSSSGEPVKTLGWARSD